MIICTTWMGMKLYEGLIKHQFHSFILLEVLFIVDIQFPFSSFRQGFFWFHSVVTEMFIVFTVVKLFLHCFHCLFYNYQIIKCFHSFYIFLCYAKLLTCDKLNWCQSNHYLSVKSSSIWPRFNKYFKPQYNLQLTIFYSVNNKIEVFLHV